MIFQVSLLFNLKKKIQKNNERKYFSFYPKIIHKVHRGYHFRTVGVQQYQ